MDDLISRQAVIDKIAHGEYVTMVDKYGNSWMMPGKVIEIIDNVPTADLFEYSDKLWKTAYERGKAEAHPRTGKWVLMSDCTGKYYACSWCGREGYSGMNYCPNCGARMEESE